MRQGIDRWLWLAILAIPIAAWPVHHIRDELTRGIVDLRVIIWWSSFTFLMLFIATKVLERRRW